MQLDELQSELGRRPEPKQSLLDKIAKELVLPSFVFFMKEAPALYDVIPDFRSPKPGPSPKSRETTESIQFAAAIQNTVAELRPGGTSNLPVFDSSQQHKVEDFALRARSFFNITLEDQLRAKDARAFYIVCRKKIEDKGIFVIHDSFPESDGSGFCLAHPLYPIIVVNTKRQTRGRRLFTLIHELAHVLTSQTGISDPFIRKNSTEKLCNQFAGSFLVPRTYAPALLRGLKLSSDPDLDEVTRVARRLKISQQAAVLRLEQLGLFKSGSHNKWLTAVHNLGNPDFIEKGGGAGGPPPQEKVKLAKYGFRFAMVFDELLRSGLISQINLFRSTGLKPKYVRGYFDYARSISDTELPMVELDD